jgi:hypothetical protein
VGAPALSETIAGLQLAELNEFQNSISVLAVAVGLETFAIARPAVLFEQRT